LGSEFSIGEVRLLYELAYRDRPTACEMGTALGLDPAYVSRTLRSFQKRGLVVTSPGDDRRCRLLTLTPEGRKAFAPLEALARGAVVDLIEPLTTPEQERVIEAMRTIRVLLKDPSAGPGKTPLFVLRPHRPSDLGWIIHRQSLLYAQEYGYDARFEAYIAKVAAEFLENYNPKRERCWIAERNGDVVGTILVTEQSKAVAQLRLFFVEPSARGVGLGRRLVDEATTFARLAGYRKMQLWTLSELKAARKIYEEAGFKMVEETPHESFGKKLSAETWELKL
jgi:DNA-binding MarR family transcriptional regulator/GNAT superfamily N-acetyltransferase